MTFKPTEINPTIEEPFKGDKLERKQLIEALTTILTNTEKGFVLSINAAWGYGKTTFIKMWEKDLQKNGYKTIYFNAWESDFVADPMMALIDGLREGFEEKDLPQEKLQKLSALWDIIIEIVPFLPTPNAQLIGGVAKAAKKGVCSLLKDKNQLQKHQSIKKLVNDFKKQLVEFAKEIGKDKQLIIFVDELDRCRPDYAVQMLERIKHFFAIDNIIFVLSIDKSVLCKSIRAVYGGLDIDTEAYLRRFIDIEFYLPTPKIDNFIVAQHDHHNINECFDTYFERMRNQYRGQYKKDDLLRTIKICFSSSTHSLRDVEKFYNRLELVIRSLATQNYPPEIIVFFLYFYVFKKEIIDAYRKANISPKDFWQLEENHLNSCHFDSEDTQYSYQYWLIHIFANYLYERRNKVLENERETIVQGQGGALSWFSQEYREILKNQQVPSFADIKGLLDVIELVSINFQRRIIEEFQNK